MIVIVHSAQEYSGPTLGLILLRFAQRLRRRPHGHRIVIKMRDDELCSE